MLFNYLLVSGFFLASVVLADLRFGNREPSILNYTEDATLSSPDWAGAVWQTGNNNFNYVVATFTVPKVTDVHNSGGSAFAWVGIDGITCRSVLFRTGIDFFVDSHGTDTYRAWYQWYPDSTYNFDLAISPGDEVRLWVHAYTSTSGIAEIHNLSTNKYAVRRVASSHALCGQNAGWVLQAFKVDGQPAPLADFGTLTFKDTKATGPPSARTANGATTVDMSRYARTLATAEIDGSSVTVDYVYQVL